MTIEVRPLGVKCNLACDYCYQQPQREARNGSTPYNLDVIKSALEQENGQFIVFGGEPLMVPIDDLEALWAWGYERYGRNGIQTNGTLITHAHMRLFKKYRVHVGISIDGPGELNDARWGGTLEKTRKATAKTEKAIERLCREGMPPSLIVTLYRNNATAERLPVMHAWCRYLEKIGITSVRLHMLEVDHQLVGDELELSTEENTRALLSFARLETELASLKFDVFDDMRKLLMGRDDEATCVWTGCDPYTTRAVRGIEGNGQRTNCGRTNKEGVDFAKSDQPGFERYIALYHTPQEYGGCRNCRFFLMCKGQCPGTAMHGDWRNRSEHCEVWKSLFRHVEDSLLNDGRIPLSVDPKRPRLEAAFLAAWSRASNPAMHSLLESLDDKPPRKPSDPGGPESIVILPHKDFGHSDFHHDHHADHNDKGKHKDAHGDTHGDKK